MVLAIVLRFVSAIGVAFSSTAILTLILTLFPDNIERMFVSMDTNSSIIVIFCWFTIVFAFMSGTSDGSSYKPKTWSSSCPIYWFWQALNEAGFVMGAIGPGMGSMLYESGGLVATFLVGGVISFACTFMAAAALPNKGTWCIWLFGSLDVRDLWGGYFSQRHLKIPSEKLPSSCFCQSGESWSTCS